MTEYVLEILDGDHAGETIPLDQGRVTLGRRPECTVSLADEKVSGQHAEVAFEDGRHVLRDLGSRNGTFLDGRKVDEVILTEFDTFHVGRLRVQFKEAGAEPGLALHRIGQDRLAGTRGKRGAVGLVVAVIVLAGAGGYYAWQNQQADDPAAASSMSIPRVAGNKLPEGADSCEDLEQWNLSVSGSGFEPGGPARTGSTALMAYCVGAEDGGDPPADHALARLTRSITAVSGEHLSLVGYLQTSGGGLAALRVRFTSSQDEAIACWTGTVPADYEGYQKVELNVAVPPGADRVAVEVLALLPAGGAEVLADDLALVDGGGVEPIDYSASGFSLAGVGSSVELRAGQELVLERIAPHVDGGPLAGLAAADLHGLSDAGLQLGATADEQAFHLSWQGDPAIGGIDLMFSARAAGSGMYLRGGDDDFVAARSDFDTSIDELLLGSGSARLMVRVPTICRSVGRWQADRFVVSLESADKLDLVVGFDEERRAAAAMWREVQELRDGGEPGAALDKLRELVNRTPHDSELVSKALRMRADLLAAVGRRIEELRVEFGMAEFFRTRGEYVRIGRAIDVLVAAYGSRNISEFDTVKATREQVAARLSTLDADANENKKAGLEALVEVFEAGGDTELRELVNTYIEKHHRNGG